ncbi:MAG: aldo/keto reductase family protein [Actinomycetota bacterium]|nr:aldo/keto reductase family protein [Euzebyales bacterium]MDQ3344361.1 aldo/keto reductase family protein [Actinomycetota bacterium]MDQ3528558.1 aldo/keto reductase family protein [Actinomycetota bacterium]
MQYRKLGRWGMQVSSVGLGSWLTYAGSVEADTAKECIHRAYDLGVNFFDTANVYMRGQAEEIVGEGLSGYPRDSFVLATKVFFPMGDRPNDTGLSRKHVTEQCHHSLRRLGTDYIDLYQCHRYDEDTPLEETCRVMDDLIRAGKVLYWGVSEWSADQIAHAVSICRTEGWALPASNQPQYSALWRQIEDRVLPTCEDLGLGSVVWSPLAMGILTGKYTSVDDVPDGSRAAGSDAKFMDRYFNQDVLDAVAEAKAVADEAGCTLSQLALAWCLRQDFVSSVIVGATKTEHVDDNVAAADLDLGDEVIDAFDELLEPVAAS